ncbi:MAG: hypothetical protein ACRDNZ_04650, partial [Streptosporangiaceae bacterium]
VVYEPESGLVGPAEVTEIDTDKRLVYLAVDWQALTQSEGEEAPPWAAKLKQYGYREADLETELRRPSAEQDVSVAKLEAASIRYEAELAAQSARYEAELAAKETRTKAQLVRAEAQLREAKRRRHGLWGWMHGALTAPVLIIILVMTAGAAVPLYERNLLVAYVFTAAAAFVACVYGVALFASAMALTFSGSNSRREAGERTLRLLLGSSSKGAAQEQASAIAIARDDSTDLEVNPPSTTRSSAT